MALIFWAWVWGPVGMFIAVPLTSIINIVLLELNRFRNITDIISYTNK
jgi:predicted PurR-regulated permease PerM